MTILATGLTSGFNATLGTSFTTASVAPGANKLVLLAVELALHVAAPAFTPTVTGCGLTWELVADTGLYPSTAPNFNGEIALFRAMGSAPTAGVITISTGTNQCDSAAWSVVEFDGVEIYGGANGSSAIVQAVVGHSEYSDLSLTLAAFGSTANATFGAFGVTDTAYVSFTPEAGFTKIHDIGGASSSVMTEFDAANSTTVTATASASTLIGGIAVELKAYVGTATLTEDTTTDFPNPERGWYLSLSNIWGPYSSAQLQGYYNGSNHHSTFLYLLYLDNYINTATIDAAFLTTFTNDLDAMRAAGVKCFLRCSYDHVGNTTDAAKAIMLSHIDQLAPIITSYHDTIPSMQMGFIGAYGEWWGSSNFGTINNSVTDYGLTAQQWADRKEVVERLLSQTPTTLTVALRSPVYKMNMYGSTALTDAQRFNGTSIARLGAHNDAFCSTASDQGTYVDTATEYPYLEQETKWLPWSGEADEYDPPRSDSANAMVEMAQFHSTILNSDYNTTVLNAWSTSGDYTTIAKSLGYRLYVSSSTMQQYAVSAGTFRVQFDVHNHGYAAPISNRTVNLVLKSATNTYRVAIPNIDIREWLPTTSTPHTIDQTVTLPTVPLGTYDLHLEIPDSSSNYSSNPVASIRFANQSAWDATTGFNTLSRTLTVANGLAAGTGQFTVTGVNAGSNIVMAAVVSSFAMSGVNATFVSGNSSASVSYSMLADVTHMAVSTYPIVFNMSMAAAHASFALTGGIALTATSVPQGQVRVARNVPTIFDNAFPQVSVTNEGVRSETATKLLNGTDGVHKDWDYEMTISSSKVVIIGSLGYDEMVTGMSISEWTTKLTQIAQTAMNHGKLVVFVSMHTIDPARGDLLPYVTAMSSVATATGAGYIDMFNYTASKFTGPITNWLPDGVTPNQAAYDIIGKQIVDQYPIVYKKLTSVDTTPAPTVNSLPAPFGQDATLYPSLTFAEDFNGSALSTLWSLGNWYETPNTLQNYTVQNGSLVVWAQQKPDGTWDPHNFTCTTDGTFYQKYGYFEIEAKLPAGAGVWPAFWMYSHDTSARPEIVFMQTWPSDTVDSYGDASYKPHDYAASATNPSASSVGTRRILGSIYNSIQSSPDLSAGFHKYGVRWDASGVQFYFDGQPVGSKLLTTALNSRMFFVIDLWIGGKALAPDSSTPTTVSQGMVVNYLRAWSLNDGSTVVSGSAVGTTVPTPAAPAPTPTPVPTAPIPVTSQFHVGIHAHRLYNGGGSPEPTFNYGVIRDWDIEGLQDAVVWKSDNTIDFTSIKTVYDGHAKHGAKVIKCFGTVPTWASKRPTEPNASYPAWPGAKSGPANLDQYEDYCYRFISTLRGYLFAVEGWNEPYGYNTNPTDASADNPQYTTMTGTELADAQKRLYLAAKRVDANLPVISPAQSYLDTIPLLLNLTTSQGEPIWQFFDVLGVHLYNHTADGIAGPNIGARISIIKNQMTAVGISKPIADTEHGWLNIYPTYSTWVNATSDQKGQILYNTAKAARDNGVVAVAYYSYDDDLIGSPYKDPTISTWLGNAYNDMDTKYQQTTTPTPTVPSPPPTSSLQPFGQSGTYTLTFNDEFTAGALDFTKWNDHIWYETSDPTINYAQQNGSLFIWPASNFVNRTIDTDGKFQQVYGFFEMEAKLPIGLGVWPSFWLYAHNDAGGNKARPEIDIMEAYPGGGAASGWSDANLHPTNYAVTLHEANLDYSFHQIPYSQKLTNVFSATDLSAGYHKYGVKWESNGVTFYFDGQQLGSKWLDTTGYFDQPMYILLDLWFGSVSGTPGPSTPTGISNSFEIRYVRCWSFGASSPAPLPTPAPTVTPTPVPTAPTPVPAPSQAPTQTVVVDYYGDSTIYGYMQGGGRANPTPVQTFAANLKYSSWYQVNNKGVSGQGTNRLLGNGSDAWYGGVAPLDQLLQQSNAKYCIFNHLLNDADPSQENNTVATYETNLRQIVALVRSYSKIVIFETPNPTANYPIADYLTVMRKVATDLNVPLIDEYTYVTGYIAGQGIDIHTVEPDGSHPNQTLYNLKGVYAAQQFQIITG